MGIEISELSKSFDGKPAVTDISLSIPTGAFFCVVGPSGCGKSTLLRLIAGLEAPDHGRISLAGQSVCDGSTFVAPEDRQVGVVFQSYALWPHLSVTENVSFPYESKGMDRAEAARRAAGHLETVALSDYATRRPQALSGGQRQRVALARCLAGDARTILMDEPLANLDPHLRGAMEAELRAFHDRSGATTLFITHDQREAMALADIMAVMDAGRFLQIGPPAGGLCQAKDQRCRGPVHRARRRWFLRRCGPMGWRISPVSRCPCRGTGDGPSEVFLRPEHIAVGEGLAARVTTALYRGGYWEATARVDGLTTDLQLDLRQPVRVGDQVPLRFTGGWILPG